MGLPPGNRFINAKERKVLLRALDEQFGISSLPDTVVFVQNNKDKVSVINRDVERVPFDSMYVDTLGLYIGRWQVDGFRLSMEGAQLFAPFATKNIVLFGDEQRRMWLKGLDIPWESKEKVFVIIKHEGTGDVLGSGKIRQPRDEKNEETMILNFVPKARRLIVINE